MVATTSYGTWNNFGDKLNVSVEATIADVVNGADGDWREWMVVSEGFERIAADYRDAINKALPDGAVLAGNEFYGPHYGRDQVNEGYPIGEDGTLDISAVVKGIDLEKIIERHDITEETYLAQPQPEMPKSVIYHWASKRFRKDVALLFTSWIDEIWNQWDPEEFPAGDVLAGALADWRGGEPGDLE